MFGSSQDRARQLAGRHRKDRKTSGSSYLSSRSVSSSTQSSTQLQTTYTSAIRDMRHSSRHIRELSHASASEQHDLPLPPNALPTQPLLGEREHPQHGELLNANATIHDISSLFKDLSAHSPIASALHDTTDQFAARLRVLLVQDRTESDHIGTLMNGNPSVPNLTCGPSSALGTGYPSGSYLSTRRIASQPPPRRTPSHGVENSVNVLSGAPSSNYFWGVRNLAAENHNPGAPYKGSPANKTLPPTPMPDPTGGRQKILLWPRCEKATSYFTWCDWVIKSRDRVMWNEPITPLNCPGFGVFLNNLDNNSRVDFHSVFEGNAFGDPSHALTAKRRRDWYQSLSPTQRQNFIRIVQCRRTAIEQDVDCSTLVFVNPPTVPAMMMHEALEAIETRYGTSTASQPALGTGPQYSQPYSIPPPPYMAAPALSVGDGTQNVGLGLTNGQFSTVPQLNYLHHGVQYPLSGQPSPAGPYAQPGVFDSLPRATSAPQIGMQQTLATAHMRQQIVAGNQGWTPEDILAYEQQVKMHRRQQIMAGNHGWTPECLQRAQINRATQQREMNRELAGWQQTVKERQKWVAQWQQQQQDQRPQLDKAENNHSGQTSAQNTQQTPTKRLKTGGGANHLEIIATYFGGGGGGGSAASSTMKNNLNKLFDSYRDDAKNSPDAFGPDASMAYFGKLDVDLEGIDSLIVQEIIQAPTVGEVTREGFVDGWSAVNADTLDKQKAHLNTVKKRLTSDKETYEKVYKYTFFLGLSPGAKGIPLEAATACWEILFTSPYSAVRWSSPSSPWFDWWREYLESEWKKSVNKDMWNETLKFAKLALEDEGLGFWDESSSWPSVIDDFVEWVKREKRAGAENADEMEE